MPQHNIAAGEVFKAARLQPRQYSAQQATFYSIWAHRAASFPLPDGPSSLEIHVDAGLAGVGAVGSALIHTLWSCPGITGRHALLADNDHKGLEATNLNRYALFGRDSIGLPKATEAARIASDGSLCWAPEDRAFEDLDSLPARVVSAVDRNTSRQAIQNRYPARIFSGSTLDLRAEVLRCGPPGIGVCLRCYNPPERALPDEQIRAYLRTASEDQLCEMATANGLNVEDIRQWADTGRLCGLAA